MQYKSPCIPGRGGGGGGGGVVVCHAIDRCLTPLKQGKALNYEMDKEIMFFELALHIPQGN